MNPRGPHISGIYYCITYFIAAIISLSSSETVYGIWNTIIGGDSNSATGGTGPGRYISGEPPDSAFVGNCSTKYNGYGLCNSGSSSTICGTNTGFYVTPIRGAFVVTDLRFCTGNDAAQRDPLTLTLEGSNQITGLTLSSSWALIYSGSTGLDSDPGRSTSGVTQIFSSNAIAYASYRVIATSKRDSADVLQYSEVEFLGY